MSGADPMAADSIGPVPAINPQEARAAAVYVAGALGRDCRDVLEALGLVGYTGRGAADRQRAKAPRWRPGTVRSGT